jgi:hypothetical protein
MTPTLATCVLAAPALAAANHPVITEVLYFVPSKKAGDANKDGERDPAGDEFVEITNLSRSAIELGGYAIIDSDAWWFLSERGTKPVDLSRDVEGKNVLFVFPKCRLEPGASAVVFNGFGMKSGGKSGPMGTKEKAAGANAGFGGALVFSAEVATVKAGFGNDGDWVALVSPAGEFVQVVRWGKPDHEPPTKAPVSEAPAEPRGSAQRTKLKGEWVFVDHATLGGGGQLFSPGVGDAGVPKDDAEQPKDGTGEPGARPSLR